VVCTSSLDLGIDWGDVDLVVQIGAPKGVSRILQRIGRANHRLDQPSRALLVPGNRFEVLECMAALDAIFEHTLDGAPPHPGGLDVLAQHLVGVACCGPFDADEVFAEVRSPTPTSPGAISTTFWSSSQPAATRSASTSVSGASGKAATGCGVSPIAGSPGATG
jgi:Lhr-like helicase